MWPLSFRATEGYRPDDERNLGGSHQSGTTEETSSISAWIPGQAGDQAFAFSDACILWRMPTTLRPFSCASSSAVGWPAIPP